MRPVYRFLGIITALDFLRATQALRRTVADHAPENATQEAAIRATRDLPEVQEAKRAMLRELALLVAVEFFIVALIVWWVMS